MAAVELIMLDIEAQIGDQFWRSSQDSACSAPGFTAAASTCSRFAALFCCYAGLWQVSALAVIDTTSGHLVRYTSAHCNLCL